MRVREFEGVRVSVCESISILWEFVCVRLCDYVSMCVCLDVGVSMWGWVCVSVCECVWVCNYEYTSIYLKVFSLLLFNCLSMQMCSMQLENWRTMQVCDYI